MSSGKIMNEWLFGALHQLGLYSQDYKASYHKITRSPEAARLRVENSILFWTILQVP